MAVIWCNDDSIETLPSKIKWSEPFMAKNDVLEYWVTIRFVTGSDIEFHVTGFLNATKRAQEIIVKADVVLLELNIKVIQ